jgi:hypothetical protein
VCALEVAAEVAELPMQTANRRHSREFHYYDGPQLSTPALHISSANGGPFFLGQRRAFFYGQRRAFFLGKRRALARWWQ